MNYVKKILKNIRLFINRLGSKKRSTKLLAKNPTIISNNCYAGITYEYLGIKFYSPTIGLYFFANEYIKFCSNLKYYVSQKVEFIEPENSRYYDELKRKHHDKSIIGKIDDVEIVFLHYKTKEEARKKWKKRCKRINYDCLILKFCDQNLCTYDNIKSFDNLPYKNKFCFSVNEYPEFDSVICFKNQHNKQEVERDYYVQHKYFDIISFINNIQLDISVNSENMPIRVLQVGMTYNLGGIENFLINYYRHIDKSKIQFDFINIYDSSLCFENEIKSMGGEIYNVSNYYKYPFRYIKEVIKIINNNSYTIIHCNMNSAVMMYPLIAARLSKAKIIISHSHNSSSDKGLTKSLIHNINKHFIPMLANRYFACSDKAGKWFYNKKILNSNKYRIIYNAINLDLYRYSIDNRNKIRNELNIKDDKFVIGHVGRFNKQKNHQFLIKIFHELKKRNNNFILLLIGQGPLSNEIKKMVKELDIKDDVIFLGQRNDINKIYSAMDLFLLPSLYEGLPLVGVEAQVNGLKCLFSSEITRELSLSKNISYIDLNINSWIEAIINTDFSRNINKIDDTKYDIKYNANKLKEIYMEDVINCDKK